MLQNVPNLKQEQYGEGVVEPWNRSVHLMATFVRSCSCLGCRTIRS